MPTPTPPGTTTHELVINYRRGEFLGNVNYYGITTIVVPGRLLDKCPFNQAIPFEESFTASVIIGEFYRDQLSSVVCPDVLTGLLLSLNTDFIRCQIGPIPERLSKALQIAGKTMEFCFWEDTGLVGSRLTVRTGFGLN